MRTITNVRLPHPRNHEGDENLWCISLDNLNRIVEINPIKSNPLNQGQDWKGDWLSPMGVDLQFNGGMGINFPDINNKDIPTLFKLLDHLWADGVEAICPTIITCEIIKLRKALQVFREARKHHHDNRCKLLGAHLEGPFLASERRGAHPKEHLCQPSLDALSARINGFEKEICLMTIAPEISGTAAVISRLKALNIIVSLGHSKANTKESQVAFNQGISMLTHTFNAMPGLHHREPGPIGSALNHGDIALGLIADGVHVNPTMAVLLHRLAPEQVVLVSDMLFPYGLKDTNYQWNQKLLLAEKGTCKLEDGTLVGVKSPFLDGCKRLAKWNGTPSAAIWAATMASRKVLGERRPIQEFLKGQTLMQLLRWRGKLNGDYLNWQHAA